MKLYICASKHVNEKLLKVEFNLKAIHDWQHGQDSAKKAIEFHFKDFHKRTHGEYALQMIKI